MVHFEKALVDGKKIDLTKIKFIEVNENDEERIIDFSDLYLGIFRKGVEHGHDMNKLVIKEKLRSFIEELGKI